MTDTWKPISGIDLRDGDILRQEYNHNGVDAYLYAICTGSGFGCRAGALGNAIFVHHQGWDLQHVKNAKAISEDKDIDGSRWERFEPIEVMVDE